jgi:hypothetical protein
LWDVNNTNQEAVTFIYSSYYFFPLTTTPCFSDIDYEQTNRTTGETPPSKFLPLLQEEGGVCFNAMRIIQILEKLHCPKECFMVLFL